MPKASAPGSTLDGRRGVAILCVAMLAWACGTQVPPAPSAYQMTATPTQASPPSILTPSPSPAYADTLRVGWDTRLIDGRPFVLDGFRHATGASQYYQIALSNLVYSTIYRWDARFNVVPDLADGPCTPQGDGTVIRCRIVETTFHDGTPLTADDVAYSYRLLQRDTFYYPGVTGKLREVRIVDPRTVDFVLRERDATFLSIQLPSVVIFSRRAVEASFANFVAGTKDLSAAELTKLADAIDGEVGRDPPVCSTRLDAVATFLAKIGVRLYREDFSRGTTRTFDPCAYMGIASGYIRQAGVVLDLTGLDAVAAAYQLLSIDRQPIGTGPYRLVSEGADRIHLEAWPGYHAGIAATRYLDFVPAKADGSDILDGALDIFQLAILGPNFAAAASSHGVRIATPAEGGFYALDFNARPEHLFADRDLRQALQLCVDLPRDVDAATAGTGRPVYGPVIPGSWADEPNIPKPIRYPIAARRLIEAAGWQVGADGIYAKDGARLSAPIVVRADKPDRIKMADLIALQARDCGMDLRTLPAGWEDIQAMYGQYPHAIPGTGTPFDLYLGGWATVSDPADGLAGFSSSNITDAEHPDGNAYPNYGGFRDPTLDRLIEAGATNYDQAERARLYREAQSEIAAQVPMIFLWAANAYDTVRASVETTSGPLDLTTPNWAWQPERMVVAASTP